MVRRAWTDDASDQVRASALTALVRLAPRTSREAIIAGLRTKSYREAIQNAALAAARNSLPRWRSTSAEERARLLERAADLIAGRRFELNALEILEAGKPWLEADADVTEAIDFCRFYASEMRKLKCALPPSYPSCTR